MLKIMRNAIVGLFLSIAISLPCYSAPQNVSAQRYDSAMLVRENNDQIDANEQNFQKFYPYLDAIVESFARMLKQFNTAMPEEELAKQMTQKAIKAMVDTHPNNAAFTPQETVAWNDATKGFFYGIGAQVSQPTKWILEKTEESFPKNPNDEYGEESENTILGLKITNPAGKRINTLNTQEIPCGSKMIIFKKNPKQNNALIKNQYIKIAEPLKIIEIIPGGGAEEIGLKSNDIISEIETNAGWIKTENFTISENCAYLKGPNDTPVNLMITRGSDKFKSIIVRKKIDTTKFNIENKEYGDTMYIKIKEFNRRISDETKKILDQISQKNIKKIVIDLRNNPGGVLEEALETLSYFVPRNHTMICITSKDQIIETRKSSGKPLFNGKIVVLINNNSASASEIMAGVLKYHGLAKIFGEKSYGKGSVQRIFPLTENDAIPQIKITISEYKIYNALKNNAEKINARIIDLEKVDGVGIAPDIEIDATLPIEKIMEIQEIQNYLNN